MAAFFVAFTNSGGNQLYTFATVFGVDIPVQWTAPGFDLNPHDLTFFNNAVWFDGNTASANGNQLYKLGIDGSVTKWTATGANLDPTDLTVFNNALWFNGFNAGQNQLYKLGNDGSVTQWTANPGAGIGLEPFNMAVFNDALWFDGATPANGFQLYKLGNDGSVTKWTSIGTNLEPEDLTVFNNALWFHGINAGQGQLYKLGFDGSVTQWTANPGSGFGLEPFNMTVFNGALWFEGVTPAHGQQLFKLGNDGSVTQWTDIGTGLNPIPVSTAAGDPDSTPLSTFNNALWFSADNPSGGRELYKLGADGSFTFWKDINPGAANSNPHDWAVLG